MPRYRLESSCFWGAEAGLDGRGRKRYWGLKGGQPRPAASRKAATLPPCLQLVKGQNPPTRELASCTPCSQAQQAPLSAYSYTEMQLGLHTCVHKPNCARMNTFMCRHACQLSTEMHTHSYMHISIQEQIHPCVHVKIFMYMFVFRGTYVGLHR